jgi:tetratricopeptide (TPR) repeat protein
MTPADRKLARDLLSRNRLTLEQVTSLKEECDRTGRPFAALAAERGLIRAEETPAAPRPARLFLGLLVASLAIFAGLLAWSVGQIRAGGRREQSLADESARSMAEADRMYERVRRDYARKVLAEREVQANTSLEKARADMAFAEERLREAPAPPDLDFRLVEATLAFNRYLEIHPEDAAVLAQRARAHELRGHLVRAVEDLERALELRPDLEASLGLKLADLRDRLQRPP